MNLHIPTIIATLINFCILLFILKFYLFKPVNKIMDDRQNEINMSIAKAKDDEEKAEISRKEKEQLLNEAKIKGREIVEEYKVNAENISQEIINEAKKESIIIMERARIEIEREKHKSEHEIKEQVIDLSLILSERALEQIIDEKEHRRLIEDFIFKVGS